MKKLILPVALGFSLLAVSCQPDKAETRKNFIDKCVVEAYKGANTDEQKKMMDEYCACAADKVLDKFSTKEIADMEKPEMAAELQEKMMPVIQPCLDDLTNKMMSAMQQEMPVVDTALAPVE